MDNTLRVWRFELSAAITPGSNNLCDPVLHGQQRHIERAASEIKHENVALLLAGITQTVPVALSQRERDECERRSERTRWRLLSAR